MAFTVDPGMVALARDGLLRTAPRGCVFVGGDEKIKGVRPLLGTVPNAVPHAPALSSIDQATPLYRPTLRQSYGLQKPRLACPSDIALLRASIPSRSLAFPVGNKEKAPTFDRSLFNARLQDAFSAGEAL